MNVEEAVDMLRRGGGRKRLNADVVEVFVAGVWVHVSGLELLVNNTRETLSDLIHARIAQARKERVA